MSSPAKKEQKARGLNKYNLNFVSGYDILNENIEKHIDSAIEYDNHIKRILKNLRRKNHDKH